MEAVKAGLSAMAIIDAMRKAFRKDSSISGDEPRGSMEWEAEESKQEGGLPKVLQVSVYIFDCVRVRVCVCVLLALLFSYLSRAPYPFVVLVFDCTSLI